MIHEACEPRRESMTAEQHLRIARSHLAKASEQLPEEEEVHMLWAVTDNLIDRLT